MKLAFGQNQWGGTASGHKPPRKVALYAPTVAVTSAVQQSGSEDMRVNMKRKEEEQGPELVAASLIQGGLQLPHSSSVFCPIGAHLLHN